MNNDIEKSQAGSSFEDFLKEEGTYEGTTEHAVKRVLAQRGAAASELRRDRGNRLRA